MAIVSSNPSSVVSAGTWATSTNVYTSNDTYATNTGSVQNTEYPMEIGGFNFSALLPGDTLIGTTVTVEAKTGTNNRAQIKVELMDGTTVLATRALANLSASDVNYTLAATPTLAQLQSANLKVRVTNKRIVSQASTTSVDYVKIDVEIVNPKIDTFTDTFDTLDTPTKWTVFGTTPTATAGRLQVQFSGTAWSGVQSANLYTLAESSAHLQLWPQSVAVTGRSSIFRLQKIGGTDWIGFGVIGFEPLLVMFLKENSVGDDTSINPYDPVEHAWLRVRLVGTTAYWDTSRNGITWTNRRTRTVDPTKFGSLQLELSAGQSPDSGASTVYYDNLNITPSNPKTSTLVDTFDTQIDPATWSTWGGTVWEGGRVKAQPAVATGGYGGVYTVGEYDFTESTIFARVVPPQEATGRETMVQLYKDDNNLIAAIISNWGLFLRIRQGAVNTDGGTITYHGAALAWIRLRMSGTTVYLDSSADGTTWYLQQSATTSLDMTSCKVYLMSGQWQAESAIVPAYFDNINTTVAAPLLGTLSDSFDTTVDPLLWRNNGGSVSWEAGQARVIGGNPGYTYLMSQLVYDLRESSIYAKIALDSVGWTGSESILRISAPWDNHNVMIYNYSSGGARYIKARSRENSVNYDSPVGVGPLPLTCWLRIGLSGTTVSYDWSVDGSSWTSIWTRTVTPANLAVVQVFFECGNWQAEAGWLTSYVDNVNVSSATGRPKAWMGTQYEKKPGKWWNGSAWVEKPWKEWDGSSWKTVK